ncbi:MAG: TonB-dependent receptor [Gemmatimonadota bacterium]
MRAPVFATLALLVTAALQAQTDTTRKTRPDSTAKVAKLGPIEVTATRSEKLVFRTATPILVIDSSAVREVAPNGVADLFRNLPGVDVTGVGPNQGRLVIRGQRGQRILLAEDGIRLNNARRQQDFGELPAITDINDVSRIEVVRGPASVLYGTDAIGGVVNQVTLQPPGPGAREGIGGSILYRYGGAADQNLVHGRIFGRAGRFGFSAAAGLRDADPYDAPAGSFGQIRLDHNTRVNDTGIRDRNYSANLRWDPTDHQTLSVRVSRYSAREAGFGYVDPGALHDTSGVLVRLLYPDQGVTRATLGYRATALRSALADWISVSGYTTRNNRIFAQQIGITGGLPPGASIDINSQNFTDIKTYGFRLEAAKIVAGRHTITYGADWAIDRSANTDSSVTSIVGLGPPSTDVSTTPTVPNASFWNGGVFAQGDFRLTDRFTLGAGVRAQRIHASTRETPGLPAERSGVSAGNGTVVGSVSGQWLMIPELSLVATVGRAFRAPNLVERYFEGVTPEGNGFQMANPALKPETSLNYDLGFKLRKNLFYAEVFVFQNTISNGVRIVALGTTVSGFPAFQNQNIDRLRDRGVEALAEAGLGGGFSVIGHYTRLRSKNPDGNAPIGDSYSSKVGGELAWRERSGRFFAAYEVRHQGERKDILLTASPVGSVLPAFTVQNARAGLRLPAVAGVTTGVMLAVQNLTDRLYAEAPNTSFFRPEPRRSVVATVQLGF